ncbi:calmodulin-binding protein 25 [Heracleum sosnowskyi]|uniref:Calmodulin-binding protein 25 n=1 Tax=Heracleum sosnowskyi TaxID=360622 RepID=A0AAD8HG14_9APIA|nr:calmodulin-binding protein 25 [Heracleum sosnowskyi]
MDFLSNSEWEEIGSWVTKTLTEDNTGPHQGHQMTAVKSPSLSGSDPDTGGGRGKNGIAAKGKIAKRKSRASTKNRTTFITADPANFRRMVQQVTGLKVADGQVAVAPVVKPEAQRLVDRVPGSWPTLDTSAYVVGHQGVGVGPVPFSGFAPVDGGGGGGGFCFESFSFPALES